MSFPNPYLLLYVRRFYDAVLNMCEIDTDEGMIKTDFDVDLDESTMIQVSRSSHSNFVTMSVIPRC